MYFFRKLKIYISDHWLIIAIVSAIIIVGILTVIGMSMVESYFRRIQLATMPMTFLVWIVAAAISAFIYVSVLFGAFATMKKKQVKIEEVNVRFSDVIGIEDAKEEACEVVDLLKDRTRLKQIGGNILRGILMIGPPGCGKTYLAKAMATESGIPFLSIAASEFVEIFVGVGASRMRKLFKKARRLAYSHGACIVFIDELDAVGRGRTYSMLGGQEYNATLNELLVAMDGIAGAEENIIVIGATNAPEEVLDKALLRPGRFDRKIYVDKPSLDGREKIYEYYLGKVKYDPSIDIPRLARKSVGKSPADIMNIIKEAALIATRNKRSMVTFKDISDAIERIDMGIKHKRKMTEHEREMVAYHESGHLVSMYIIHPTDDVFKASIVSRRGALGVVHGQPREELFTASKDELLADIKVRLAGYISEKVKYGTTSTGVAEDFNGAMKIAHGMVWRLGMGDFLGDYGAVPPEQISEETKNKLNEQTQKIFQECYKQTEDLLKKEWHIVERFASELLKKDELEYDEIAAIFKEYGKTQSWISSSKKKE